MFHWLEAADTHLTASAAPNAAHVFRDVQRAVKCAGAPSLSFAPAAPAISTIARRDRRNGGSVPAQAAFIARHRGPGRTPGQAGRLKMRVPFVPPNPNELDIATSIFNSRALWGA